MTPNLTQDQINDVYYYLGYPLALANSIIDTAITRIETNPESIEVLLDVLTQLDSAAVKVESLNSSAGIKRIDDIEFFQSMTSSGLGSAQIDSRRQGRMLVKRLAGILGVDILGDVFDVYDRSVAASFKPFRTQL